ncbi:hypothetical protein VKT23_012361 [Stygiomarasmius scandens]|uniref:Uncharacterized protein n=1 Tax=Marasmiellus scandens TaxID=2682957 RepID=A0ABR1J8H5_9AGAR
MSITPIGTAASGSETTYSVHEVVPGPLGADPTEAIENITVNEIIVASASGYRFSASQVIDPSASTTAVVSVEFHPENCTYNGDGSGACVEAFGTKTETGSNGVLVPLATLTVDVEPTGGSDDNAAITFQVSEKIWSGGIISIILVIMLGF